LLRLPITKFANIIRLFQLGGEQGNNAGMSETVKKVFLYVLPPISFMIQLFWPAGLQFTFFISALISLTQSSLLRQLWFRNLFGIQPLPQHMGVNAQAKTEAYTGTINRYQPPTSPGAAPEKGKGFLGGALSDIQGAVSEVVKSGKKMMASKKGANGKRTAAELRHAREYDARRKREQAQERSEKAQEREAKARENAEKKDRQKH